jgi:hypothetical protein
MWTKILERVFTLGLIIFIFLFYYYVRLIPLKIMIIMMGGCRPAAGRRAPCEIDEEKKYYYEIIKLMMKKRAVLKSDFIGKYLNRVEISIAIVGRFVVPLLLISREKNFFSVAVVD